MGTVIDHAIAIPALQNQVWQQLRTIQNNPIWQVDSERVAFLTTHQNGRNTRWRNTMANGRECVIEITAWYEGLGYEYVIVDGVPYQSNRGRIRLQEVAEGTVVQWTFNYELNGVLSGLRNSLRIRRQIDADIVDSLRNLYSYMRSLSGEETIDPSSVKSIMRDAPDVEARAQYVPRHPTALDEATSKGSATPEAVPSRPVGDDLFKPPAPQQARFVIPEPPIAEEDTQPNPRIQTGAIPPVPDLPFQSEEDDVFAPPPRTGEPKRESMAFHPLPAQSDDFEPFPFDFDDGPSVDATFAAPQPSTHDLGPTPSQLQPEPSLYDIAQQQLAAEAAQRAREQDNPPPGDDPVGEAARAATEPPPPRPEVASAASQDPAVSPVSPAEPAPAPNTAEMPPDTAIKKADTARISVFEVFGLQKPSETQEMRRVEADQNIEANLEDDDGASAFFKSIEPIVPDILPEPIGGRIGLRTRQRQHGARVRRPE